LTYIYETLSPERFQQLCQAVLAALFPNLQCLPVGQPDGGRDAFLRRRADDRDLLVFQVKFVREPARAEPVEKLEDWIEREKPKVEELKRWGASRYVLLTNLQGTSHFHAGSIDRVDDYLTSKIGIDSQCWWRDDLDRRIDSISDIKWSFPEVIRGTDVLQILVETLDKIGRNQHNAIRAYVAAQYDDDKEVRFKQIELQNKLLDLFIDVPLGAVSSESYAYGGFAPGDRFSANELFA
jgi:hypothetical protein